MPLNLDSVGSASAPVTTEWGSTDALLYAIAVGAGQDPAQELSVTTENTAGVVQQTIPTFAALLGQRVSRPDIGPYDRAMLVHAEQQITVPRPLPVAGRVELVSRVDQILDKGSGALVRSSVTGSHPDTGEPMFVSRSAAFIRGEGGFGGDRGDAGRAPAPDREPDAAITQRTRPEQALLYRLTGDRNPLHSDPGFARRAGFERPILHGMCTLGFATRAVVEAFCAGDPDLLAEIGGRFTAPVMPGDALVTSIWIDGDRAVFRTTRSDGAVVIDRGHARRRGNTGR